MNIKNYMNSQQNTKNNLIDLFAKKGDVDTLISLGINIDAVSYTHSPSPRDLSTSRMPSSA